MSVTPPVVLDRPVLLTVDAEYPGPPNPFERANFKIPLRLVLHTPSLDALTGHQRDEAKLLVSLGYSSFADVWLTAGAHALGDGLVQLPPGAGLDDAGLAALPAGINHSAARSRLRMPVGGWQRWVQRANERYKEEQRDRALDAYAGAVLTAVGNRHLFVCAEPTLLAERGQPPWMDTNVMTVREAIALVALLMRQRGRCNLFYDEHGRSEHDDAFRLYAQLAEVLGSVVWSGLDDAVAAAGQSSDATHDLIFSAEDRINDLLVGCDEVRAASLLPHGGAMLATVLYHLRAVVQTASALLESVAMLACEHLYIKADKVRVNFRREEFRKILAQSGGSHLTAVIDHQRYLALSFFVAELRNPIGHGPGLRGVTNPTAAQVVSYVRLTKPQIEKLKQVFGQRRESPRSWGLQQPDALDADVFCGKFVRTVIEAFCETVQALVADLRRQHPGPSPHFAAWQESHARVRDARSKMTAKKRAELERRDTEQEAAQASYDREVLSQLALYAGLADWPLLTNLIAARTHPETE